MSIGEFVMDLIPAPISQRINAHPLGRRLARGAFWTLAGAIASRILRIPISVVLARWMGPTSYGELGMVSGSIELFGVLAGLGLGMTATKYIAELRTKDPIRAGRIIAVSTVVATCAGIAFAIVLFTLAPWLASHTLAAPQLTVPLRIGALTLLFSSMGGAQLGALAGFEAFHLTAKLSAIVGLLDIPFMLCGYFWGGLNGVLIGMTASRFCDWLLKRFAVRIEARRHNIPIILGHWKHELEVLWHFSIPAALAGLLVIPVNWICSALLVNQHNGYAEMGAYNAASQWYASLMFIPAILGTGLLPVLSDRIGERDGKSSGSVLKVMMALNAAIMVPCAIVMSILSPLIMRIYGHGYREAWPTLIAVVWTATILGIITPVGDVIAASGKMWLGFGMNAGWATVYVISTLLLVRWGSLGLASSRLIAYMFHAGWTALFAYGIISQHQREAAVEAQ